MQTSFENKNVKELLSLAITISEMELSEDKMKSEEFKEWTLKTGNSDSIDLISLIGLLDTRNKVTSREMKALRESAIAQVALKNAILISDTMKRLDKTATYLTYVSIFLGLTGVAVAILQLFH